MIWRRNLPATAEPELGPRTSQGKSLFDFLQIVEGANVEIATDEQRPWDTGGAGSHPYILQVVEINGWVSNNSHRNMAVVKCHDGKAV